MKTAIAYTDGSYNESTNTYGAGLVYFCNGEKFTTKFSGDEPELSKSRQYAGEVLAAMYATKKAEKEGVTELTIYHDLEHIRKFPLYEWKPDKQISKDYTVFMRTAMKHMKIKFVKVKAHSGNKYNEEADLLAKEACGIEC